ncbi:glycosyl hydrolase 115 family protein [Draconibacterium sp. IB214405]|uniref:glycosyl hydrolase 115 family protein n=1 Tax=Draconibacterium sp. IB214405 TaxID=3097352 RepID=UPI002A154E7F|nr:glycosyl hydrolase 115 family protein [Draconibacterium sp. IB214405]MDX8339378.1 glycosyl hydrolase 115 family protein [Draconibacterium sp. IB214405]
MNSFYFPRPLIFAVLALVMSACTKGEFIISSSKSVVDIVVNEDGVVQTAAQLFAEDVERISNRKPEIVNQSESDFQIKVGTLGMNDDFDKTCQQNGIDTDELKEKWEAFVIKSVPGNNGSKQTLLVVGSDPRGTAFGLMELCKMIGVSPWYWWNDVHPEKKETITLPNNLLIEDAPKVKFRGIFLNDEDWGLHPWAAKTFEPETGDIGPKTYEKIFELLLRLKANAIWPAMHPCTKSFYTIPGNKEMAAKYQIVVGTSHAEPMLRSNVREWDHDQYGEYDYSINSTVVKEYWRGRIEELKPEDKYIVTLGMRGIHDSGMRGSLTKEGKVDMLETIITDQREMLNDVLKKEITAIPQAFVPYKEVLEIYKNGAQIPDDVTLIWPDDNHGYIRQLSNEEERRRSGGAGVYYHISYWGRPHDFLWLESVPVSLIWEEMNKAYQTNAKDIWIVNVGDIKPNEIGMNFFLDMAWDPDQFSSETLNSYYTDFAEAQFGNVYADEIGELLSNYFQLGFSRKPEHMGYNQVYPNIEIQDPELSLFQNGDEVQARIDAYEELEAQAEKLLQQMPAHLKDAFYQLVAYKVIGAANMNKKILYAYKSRVYAEQGRTSANLYAQKSKAAFEKIKKETAYYNDSLANGKWKSMMSYNPRELPVFDEAPCGHFDPEQELAGGLIPEGYTKPAESAEACLPVFNSSTDRRYFIDVFNSGNQHLDWKIEEIEPWIKASKLSGTTDGDERIWISIDWNAISTVDTISSEVVFKINNQSYPIRISAVKTELYSVDGKLFIEDNGMIAIEAENFKDKDNTSACYWQTIQGLGRTSDAVGTYPVTATSFQLDELNQSPALFYDFYNNSIGEVELKFYCLPNQPVNEDYKLRFAVSIDNGDPVIVNAGLKTEMDEYNTEWQKNVLQAVSIASINAKIENEGNHTLTIRMIDPGVVLDKIEINFGETKSSCFGSPETQTINN